jgi:hypothetical protein
LAVGQWRVREREKDRKGGRNREDADFFGLLWTRFSPPLRPWNPSLFIGGGRGQSCLHWKKIASLDSIGKDPDRWFKVGVLSYQICGKKLTELASSGQCRHRWVVIQLERAIWGCREIAEDHFRARFVKFHGR